MSFRPPFEMDCDKWVGICLCERRQQAQMGVPRQVFCGGRCYRIGVMCDVCARPAAVAAAAAVKSDADLWVQLEFFIEYCEQFTTRNRDRQAGQTES